MYHLLPNLWKALHTNSTSTSVDVQQLPPYSKNNRLSCCNVTLAVVLSFWQKDHNHMNSYRVSMAVVSVSPIASGAAKEIHDNVGSMSPCIVMKDDGIRCQQVLSLSPECWTKMITEEIAVHRCSTSSKEARSSIVWSAWGHPEQQLS